MNFDELQKQWNTQPEQDIDLGNNLSKLKEANLPIDKVRKTMKKDFFFQLTSIPLLFTYPYLFPVPSEKEPILWWIILCISITIFIPMVYLVRFYKKSYKMDYSSLKSINWFYYNYKFSIDLFKIYTYIVLTLIVMFLGVMFLGNIEPEKLIVLQKSPAFYISIIIALLIYVAVCLLLLTLWINLLYKKPLMQLKEILDDFEE
ncbi:MAG TPA: hypothetical protein VLY87_04045 [Flavobacterium sp.]|nr:hypothetical protein [Flavobacterium sp.]